MKPQGWRIKSSCIWAHFWFVVLQIKQSEHRSRWWEHLERVFDKKNNTFSSISLSAAELRWYFGGIGRVSKWWWGPGRVWARNRWVNHGKKTKNKEGSAALIQLQVMLLLPSTVDKKIRQPPFVSHFQLFQFRASAAELSCTHLLRGCVKQLSSFGLFSHTRASVHPVCKLLSRVCNSLIGWKKI